MLVGELLHARRLAPGVSWSPYYKVDDRGSRHARRTGFLLISVNGVPHQLMAPAQWKLEQGERIYGTPYLRLPDNPLDDVLIVGAGSGLRRRDRPEQGRRPYRRRRHRPADPRRSAWSENPDRPYDDPRVTRHINDGRAFLESTDRKYDLILFALPDSLTLVSGASQIRLESFLFTEEALTSVRDHLKPDGAFAMYNYYREHWLIDRLAGTAADGFGHAPCVDTFAGAQAVVTRRHDRRRPAAARRPGRQPAGRASIAPATDDRAVPVLQGRLVPARSTGYAARLHPADLAARRPRARWAAAAMRPYADLFFMGAAFLLLETKNVATFALLFGTTWFVNALVFAGVLVIVLAAVETTRKFRTPSLPVVFAGIAASLALAWVVQPDWLLPLPFVPRLVAAILLAFLPIYLANVAFAKRFQDSSDSQSAFAVNLLGAIVGGCLEYAALLTGYSNLLIVTGLLYLAAFVLVPRTAARLA